MIFRQDVRPFDVPKEKNGPFQTFKKYMYLNLSSAVGIKIIGKNDFLLFFLQGLGRYKVAGHNWSLYSPLRFIFS